MLRRLAIAALLLVIVLVVAFRPRHDVNALPSPARSAIAQPQGGQTVGAQLAPPPPWEPLQASEPTLWKLASMGDRAAAERLFGEARQCLMARRLQDFFKGKTFETWVASEQPYLRSLDSAERARVMQGVKARIALADSHDRLCGNTDAVLANGKIYRIALAAARLGDDDATACILSGAYDAPKMTPIQAAAFDSEAMELGARALTRGHWNTVLALQTVYGVSGIEGQVGPVSHINAEDFLKVLHLQWRGTPQGTPESSELARRIEIVEAGVTPAQQFAAERWADETYARFFSASGPLVETETGGCDR